MFCPFIGGLVVLLLRTIADCPRSGPEVERAGREPAPLLLHREEGVGLRLLAAHGCYYGGIARGQAGWNYQVDLGDSGVDLAGEGYLRVQATDGDGGQCGCAYAWRVHG